jgi:hypothetical protein
MEGICIHLAIILSCPLPNVDESKQVVLAFVAAAAWSPNNLGFPVWFLPEGLDE